MIEDGVAFYDQFANAVGSKNWFAVAAIVLGAFIWAWRKWGDRVWTKIPDGWRWAPAVFIAAATGFITVFQTGGTWKAALIGALAAVWSVALPAMGGHGWIKELQILLAKREQPTRKVLLAGSTTDEKKEGEDA